MHAMFRSTSGFGRIPVLALWSLLTITVLGGGASRNDVLSQPIVAVSGVLCLGIAILFLRREQVRPVRLLLLLLGFWAVLHLLQLVPMPPEMWSGLPGRARFAAGLELIDQAGVWRPLSIMPDNTVLSLTSLFGPAALILLTAIFPRESTRDLLPFFLLVLAAGALLGAAQLGSGVGYLYRVTNEASAVGWFANRNHQAALIACGLPLFAAWATRPSSGSGRGLHRWLAAAAFVLAVPLLLITGSRAGLLLGTVGGAGGALIFYIGQRHRGTGRGGKLRIILVALPIVAGVAAGLAAIFFARDQSLQRFRDLEGGELRTELLPTYWQMVSDFFPLGSGLGTFDAAFRSYEPVETLGPRFMNHAHNDIVQVVLEAGLPGAILMTLAAMLAIAASGSVWRRNRDTSEGVSEARAGSVVLLVLALSSIVDYPLRTPLMAALATIAFTWLLLGRKSADVRRPH